MCRFNSFRLSFFAHTRTSAPCGRSYAYVYVLKWRKKEKILKTGTVLLLNITTKLSKIKIRPMLRRNCRSLLLARGCVRYAALRRCQRKKVQTFSSMFVNETGDQILRSSQRRTNKVTEKENSEVKSIRNRLNFDTRTYSVFRFKFLVCNSYRQNSALDSSMT